MLQTKKGRFKLATGQHCPMVALSAPSVLEPESVTRTSGLHLRWDRLSHIHFPEPQPIAVRLPERFRGGCSFGADI